MKKIILLLTIGLSFSMVCFSQVDKLPTWYDKRQDKADREQDKAIKDNLVQIIANARSIDSVSSRVGNLEETQYIISGNIRVFDTKKWTGEFFADYSTNRNRVDRTGFRFVFKMGESYTDKKIRELEERLDKLENHD
jgi:hypothetical protein